MLCGGPLVSARSGPLVFSQGNQIEILPVVNRADVHKLEGIVKLRDILAAYGVPQSDRT
jgi:hypothetical protein